MKTVTIQDIARVAGVQVPFHGFSTAPLRSTDKKKQSLTQKNGWGFNVLAQSLASGRSSTIGVLTQMIGSPFYDSISQGLVAELSGTGYSLSLPMDVGKQNRRALTPWSVAVSMG